MLILAIEPGKFNSVGGVALEKRLETSASSELEMGIGWHAPVRVSMRAEIDVFRQFTCSRRREHATQVSQFLSLTEHYVPLNTGMGVQDVAHRIEFPFAYKVDDVIKLFGLFIDMIPDAVERCLPQLAGRRRCLGTTTHKQTEVT